MGTRLPQGIERGAGSGGLSEDPAPEPLFRHMEPDDVEAVVSIESEAFTTPWRAATFRKLLDRPGAELRVADEEGEVVAYAVLWCILDQGELANIAVRPTDRRRGLGIRLLDHVLDVARERGVRTLYLEVRASNEPALHLYARRGFREIGVRKNYYDRPREDARVLEKRLDPDGDGARGSSA